MVAACILPFWMVLVNSFADESSLVRNGYRLMPETWSLNAYIFLFSGPQIYQSYLITVLVTAIGTILALLVTAPYAYMLSHPKLKYRKQLTFVTYFFMVFGAGLVGFYILISNWLGLKNTIWALILPYLLNPFFAIILLNFFRGIPLELCEAANIDGLNDWQTFFRIVLPISKPAVATVALFYALQYWNDWWLALLFVDDHNLHPLQMMIRQLVSNMNAALYIQGSNTNYQISTPSLGIQLATVCLTIGPVVLLYPLLQRHFVKGMTIGAVKG